MGNIVIISWGSTKGTILDAMDRLAARRHESQIYTNSPHAPISIRVVKSMLKDATDNHQHRDEL